MADKVRKEALRESEERFRSLVETTSDFIWEVDVNGTYTYASPKVRDILGYEPHEVIGKKPFDFMPPEEAERVAGEFSAIAGVGRPFSGLENINLHKNGRRVVLETSGVPVFNSKGNLLGYRGVDRDITERKRVEEALRKSEEKLRVMFESVDDGINISDMEGNILETNEAALRMYGGSSKQELVGRNGFEMVSPKDIARSTEDFKTILREGHIGTREYTFLRKNGTEYHGEVNVSLIRDIFRNPFAVVSIIRDITERKRIEEALRESEAKYRVLFDSIVVGMAVIDAETMKVVLANQAASKLLGFDSAEDLIGINPLDFIHPDDRERALRIMAEDMFKKDLREMHEIRTLTRYGREKWVSTLGARTEFGGRLAALGSFIDISERKRAEEKIRLNAMHLQNLLDLHRMADGTEKSIVDYMLNVSTRSLQSQFAFIGTMSADETVMTIHAWSKEVMEQCAITEKTIYFPIADAGLWGEVIRQRRPIIVNDYDASNEYKKGYPKGHVPIKRFLSIPIFSAGKIVAVAAVANKVSEYDDSDVNALTSLLHEMWNLIERKRVEEALLKSEAEYRLLVENANEGIIVVCDGMIRFANPKVMEISGYSREELASRPFIDFVHPDDRGMMLDRHMRRLRGEQLPGIYPFRIIDKNGNTRWLEINAVLISWGGKPATLNFLNDITIRKQMEEQVKEYSEGLERMVEKRTYELKETQEKLVRTEKLAAIGQLAGSVGHELRNPLAAIRTSAYFIKVKLGNTADEKVRRHLDMLDKQVGVCDRIITDILDFARPGKINIGEIDINKVIREQVKNLDVPKNIEISTSLAENLAKVMADSGQLERVLSNLISNAIQAMPSGGKLSFSTDQSGEFIEVKVSDTGEGISQENLNKVFEPLFTTRAKGVGLGLAIAREMVERQGGTIRVESQVSKGATFVIKLPVVGV